jgi:hypothetical protein
MILEPTQKKFKGLLETLRESWKIEYRVPYVQT